MFIELNVVEFNDESTEPTPILVPLRMIRQVQPVNRRWYRSMMAGLSKKKERDPDYKIAEIPLTGTVIYFDSSQTGPIYVTTDSYETVKEKIALALKEQILR